MEMAAGGYGVGVGVGFTKYGVITILLEINIIIFITTLFSTLFISLSFTSL